jgi:hypothetical protein
MEDCKAGNLRSRIHEILYPSLTVAERGTRLIDILEMAASSIVSVLVCLGNLSIPSVLPAGLYSFRIGLRTSSSGTSSSFDTRISDTQLTCKNENQTANSTKFERAKNTTINQINQIHSRLPSHSHQLHVVQLDIAPFPNVLTVMYGEQSESEELNSIQSININQYQSTKHHPQTNTFK